MKHKLLHLLFIATFLVTGFWACQPEENKDHRTIQDSKPKVVTPAFNADSAYAYIQKQVDFGPRVPNTPEHAACADWLAAQLTTFGADVIVQEATVEAWDGTPLAMKNIIGQYGVDKKKRIMLYAHWDTRPYADKDSTRKNEPIAGANDGGSGVGVLLEVARQLNQQMTDVGIDIIFFDTEDYGAPEWVEDDEESYLDWCLGSQYWSANKHKIGYRASYGILLDMVGGKDAVFNREGTSVQLSPNVVDKVWRTARKLGHTKYFRAEETPITIDDNYFVTSEGGVPSANIVEYHIDVLPMGYGAFHHTHKDDMSVIDKETLQAVGETVMEVIYQE
ncbi:M28 family peptidase [Sanyastnella coralliicola]|uniref:M28 family peptidase n=1 Tax=Sanyastnella coralliicola TaxID=3069118 RepID=UPI0027B8CF0E|nr:M28 family peptidase [Longitalea sp. SCSIO 12813]